MEQSSDKMIASQSRIYLSSPHMSSEGYEQQFVQEAFDTNWISPAGNNITMFEKELVQYINGGYAAAVSSGTAAIHLALRAAGVVEGDIVFCSSLTFAATAFPIVYEGAKPVFIDSESLSWNMSPIALQKAFDKYLNLGIKPKAVIVVHLYGQSADLDAIVRICKKYNVTLIEDAAESLGTIYKGVDLSGYTGTFGDYGIFSFNGNKIITTSGGGMLVSPIEERITKSKFWATQSRDEARHYQHSEIGFNYRMSNVVAGIGRGQLKVLAERISQKKYIYEYYKSELCTGQNSLEGLEMMPVQTWNEPNYWLSCITLSGRVKPLDIIHALERENIESRPVWKPMHLQPVFETCDFISEFPEGSVSEDLFHRGVCLPSDSKMTDEDLQRVVSIIRDLWK